MMGSRLMLFQALRNMSIRHEMIEPFDDLAGGIMSGVTFKAEPVVDQAGDVAWHIGDATGIGEHRRFEVNAFVDRIDSAMNDGSISMPQQGQLRRPFEDVNIQRQGFRLKLLPPFAKRQDQVPIRTPGKRLEDPMKQIFIGGKERAKSTKDEAALAHLSSGQDRIDASLVVRIASTVDTIRVDH